MKKLILHIGLHKTATTSIQHFLFKHRRQLRTLGCLYLQTGMSGNAHAGIANALKPENGNFERGLGWWNKALDELSASPCSLGILSSECFMESQGIPRILSYAEQRKNIKIQILVYVREQSSWIQAVFNEVIKDPMRRFTGNIFDLREYRQGRLNFYQTLSPWARWVGDNNMLIRPFNKTFLKKGDPVEDFFDAIGIELLAGLNENKITEMVRNASMPVPCTEFLRRCNLLTMQVYEHQRLVKALVKISESAKHWQDIITTRTNWLTVIERETIVEQCLSSNRMLEEQWASVPLGLSDISQQMNTNNSNLPLLTTNIEHEIINSLPSAVVKILEKTSNKIKLREKNKSFLSVPSLDEATRLRAVIMRQRMELRLLYAEKGGIL